MAKRSGGTRASGSSSLTRQRPAPATTVGINMRYDMSNRNALSEIEERTGVRFTLPVYDYTSRNYREATGQDLPIDAVRVIFGPGAADGGIFRDTINTPAYQNIRVLEARVPRYPGDSNGDLETFISGYESEAQLKSFLKDVERGTVRDHMQRLQYRWNHR